MTDLDDGRATHEGPAGADVTFLKTTCEHCGEIELPIDRVVLRIRMSEDNGMCVFRCPLCGCRFVREANEAMIVMLLAVGIEVSVWSTPVSRRVDTALPAFTHDDLTAFRRHLGAEPDLLRHLEAI